ncbi:MAG: protein-export membrane protein SecF, preprotein translocase subunit SecF [candidate division WWE3 bacterium CSP1-7]|uniref:Protein-export membrane protein SecF n=1 Tax=candidate division WWE3 bacterium CSP1-7 TaxID=1576480 RepID=A0A0T5ZXX4_UNCKA|nr:MAG: protein-export membrane protein SecF, preprotein translocase subunit SecF [candidate division WWE3 bacterium CSP1-7]
MLKFMRYKLLFFLVSLAVILPGLVSLISFGLKPSIDFTGGTLWEIQVASDRVSSGIEVVQSVFEVEKLPVEIQTAAEDRLLIKTAVVDSSQKQTIAAALKERIGDFTEIRFETLGPRLGTELLRKAAFAVVLATLAILLYVAYRFKNLAYGATAILAMFHDTLVLFGVFSLLGRFAGVEIGTLFVTAVLTTLSFSVHDTIVVFDRIREIRRNANLDLEEAVDQAVGETMVRSLNNSLTIIFMLLALFALGGETLKWFVFALLVGTVSGTYSSTFTAAPLLVVWHKLSVKHGWRGVLRLP